MRELIYILIYPFWMATSMFPSNRLAASPKFSQLYSVVAFLTLGLLHLYPILGPMSIVVALINWWSVGLLMHPKWVVPVLLSWAVADAVYILFEISGTNYDYILLAVYWVRSMYEKFVTQKGKA